MIVCVARLNVNVTLELVTALYEEFPAIVASIKHVPLVVAVIVAEDDEFESAHPVAVPPEAIAYVTDPLVDPPVVDIVNACVYG